MSSAPVNLFWDMGEGAAKVTLVSMQTPYWFAAKCRRRECPLEGSPFECPLPEAVRRSPHGGLGNRQHVRRGGRQWLES